MGTPLTLSQVPAETPYIQYVATNGQVLFPYPFAITQDSDLVVVVNGVTQPTDSGYTLSGQGNPNGGNLTFNAGRTSGDIITLFRDVAIQRISQIGQNSGFSSTAFNAEYNNIYLIMQQLAASIGLCLQIPNTNSPPGNTTLLPANYAGKYLSFDLNGNPVPAVLTSSTVTLPVLAGLLYPQTTAEANAGVVPTNYQWPPYTVDRYGTNTTPGTTDMYAAIQNGNNCAAQAGAVLLFNSGEVYGVNVTAHAAALSMTASWKASGGRAEIRRTDYTTSTAYFTVQCLKQFDLVMENLVVNGQVTTVAAGATPNVDLAAAGSYADNGTESLWTKPYGVTFDLTQNCQVNNCIFKNTLRAGLWFRANNGVGTGSTSDPPWPSPFYGPGTPTVSFGNKVTNCWFQRNRGVFGDCFYAEETENLTVANCYATDYQRIGYVYQNNSGGSSVGANGVLMTNCVADYGHDAVTGSSQSNAGFWMEAGDSYALVNCESKNTMIGFFAGFSGGAAQGVWRPWTASHTLTGCKAIRCLQQGYRLEYGAPVHTVLTGCFAEVNRTAAPYANCVGGAPCAVEIDIEPSGVGAGRVELIGCSFDMVGCHAAGLTQYAGVNILNGAVNFNYEGDVTIRDCSIRWLSAGGSLLTEAAVQTDYESTSIGGHNYGYVGDIVFSGANNGGAQYQGNATISNWQNHSFGYCMLSSEINNANSTLTLENTKVSLRTGGSTSNVGTLYARGCTLDQRGQIGFTTVIMESCQFADLDSVHKDRNIWGSNGGTFFQLSNCVLTRQLQISSGAGASSSHRPTTSTFTGCRWNMTYQTEPGLKIVKAGGNWASVIMNGNTFVDTGSTSTTNAFIFVSATDQDIIFTGAGNTFDSNLVGVAGGHVITVNATSYDTPQTVSGIYGTVFGTAAQPLS